MLSPDQRDTFLEHLGQRGTIGGACTQMNIAPNSIEELRQADPEFDNAVKNAMDIYRGIIENEIHRRGITGWEEKVFQGGILVGKKRKFSDRMLEIHAKRHIPEYRETVSIDADVKTGVVVLGGTVESQEEWMKKFGAGGSSLPAPNPEDTDDLGTQLGDNVYTGKSSADRPE